jgi:hypothetical protein
MVRVASGGIRAFLLNCFVEAFDERLQAGFCPVDFSYFGLEQLEGVFVEEV